MDSCTKYIYIYTKSANDLIKSASSAKPSEFPSVKFSGKEYFVFTTFGGESLTIVST